MAEAVGRLEILHKKHPDNPWLSLYLAHALLISEVSPRSVKLYTDAIEGFENNGEDAAAIEAQLDLSRCLKKLDRLEEAGEALVPAVQKAEALGDPLLLAAVRVRQAFQYHYLGRELDYAYHLLHLVENDVFPNGSSRLKRSFLDALAFVTRDLGRLDETRACKEKLLELAQETGDLIGEAEARYDIAYLYATATLPSPEAREEGRRLFEAALAAAEAAGHPSIEGIAHFQLGRLLGGEKGREHLETCLETANQLSDQQLLFHCTEALAANRLWEDPEQSQELVERAAALAAASTDPWLTVLEWEERSLVQWVTLPRSDAVARSMELLDHIEELRELQGSPTGRAGLISQLSSAYYWVSGRLLEGEREPRAETPERSVPRPWSVDRDDLDLAFLVTERMRARALLEALETARAAPPSPPAAGGLIQRLWEVRKRKAKVQRRLLDPNLDPDARGDTVAELGTLESEEGEIRHSIAGASPSYAALHEPALASLDQIEENLGTNEALLSYQIGSDEDFFGRFGGGSWLLVCTRDGTRIYRLADRTALEPALDVLLGMPNLDEAKPGLVRLFHELLEPALEELPSGVDHLVVIPDGQLHRLPFALLRSSEDAEPVVSRFQLSVAPSATLWLRWRQLNPSTSELAALVLADPLLAAASQVVPERAAPGSGGQRQWALEQGARLEPLPYARQEGHTVFRALGGAGRLLLGEDATERFLKEHDLRRYAVLHFAAHAEINDEVPERSAILLAPGADDEDGWLQPQDIAELRLDGRVVVLASCSTAAGQVLRGEGPMSLARSFFYAGAPVVVASLWPLPDDETARLFKGFYKSLAGGASVAGALAAAQREMLRRGASARAWAGLVALGNGDLVPFPGGIAERALPPWVYLLVTVMALAALVLVTRALRGRAAAAPEASRGPG